MQDRRLQPTVSDVTTSLKMLVSLIAIAQERIRPNHIMPPFTIPQGSPILIRSIPKRFFPTTASPSSPGPSSPGSHGLDEAEIERELSMDVDKAGSDQEEKAEEMLISSMVSALRRSIAIIKRDCPS